jgi:hypothetical protein
VRLWLHEEPPIHSDATLQGRASANEFNVRTNRQPNISNGKLVLNDPSSSVVECITHKSSIIQADFKSLNPLTSKARNDATQSYSVGRQVVVSKKVRNAFVGKC